MFKTGFVKKKKSISNTRPWVHIAKQVKTFTDKRMELIDGNFDFV